MLKIYPILIALNALIVFVLAALWEFTLRPVNPAVPIGLLIISLLGFYLAAEESRHLVPLGRCFAANGISGNCKLS